VECVKFFRNVSSTSSLTLSFRLQPVAYPGILLVGGSTSSVEDRGHREMGYRGGSPQIKGSGGSCNLVQEISFRIVKFS